MLTLRRLRRCRPRRRPGAVALDVDLDGLVALHRAGRAPAVARLTIHPLCAVCGARLPLADGGAAHDRCDPCRALGETP